MNLPCTLLSAGLWISAAMLGSAVAADRYAVFKSTDRGRSWARSDAGLPAGSRINAFASSAGVLLAGTDSGIFASNDAAANWRPAAGAAMTSGRILSFASAGRNVVAGTDAKGLLLSHDRGRAWAQAEAFPSLKVRSLLTHRGKLYAGTDAHGVWVCADAGHAWTRLSAGLPAQGQIFALTAVGTQMFAGLYGQGLFVWNTQRETWTKTGSVTPLALASVEGTLIAGHNPGGLHWSTDGGVSWSRGILEVDSFEAPPSQLANSADSVFAESPIWELGSGYGLAFAGAGAHIYYSENAGKTWTQARKGLPERSPGISFWVSAQFVLAGTMITDE